MGAAAVAAVLLGLLVGWVARRQLIRPVALLVHATRRVASDQLEAEIPVTWSGELGALATSFNEMTRSLRQARTEVQDLMQGLEQQVQDRTCGAAGRPGPAGALREALLARAALGLHRPRDQQPAGRDPDLRQAHGAHAGGGRRPTTRPGGRWSSTCSWCSARPSGARPSSATCSTSRASGRSASRRSTSNAVVEEALQLLANPIQLHDVRLEKALGPLPPVRADFGQLRQACVNVIMNACEALPRGGHLWIATRVVEGGRWVEMEFRDDGPGIPPERLPTHLRPVLHDQGEGDRARPLGRLRDRGAARRDHRGPEPAGEGDPASPSGSRRSRRRRPGARRRMDESVRSGSDGSARAGRIASLLGHVVSHVSKAFRADVQELPAPGWPRHAFDQRRNQYSSGEILKWLLPLAPPGGKVLGVTDRDLFIPILTYVFGEAQLGGAAAVVSIARLGDELESPGPGWCGSASPRRRSTSWGTASACGTARRPGCVMGRSASVRDVDEKGQGLCIDCRARAARGPEGAEHVQREHADPGGRRRGDCPRVARRLAGEGRLLRVHGSRRAPPPCGCWRPSPGRS